jgi:hypothetical protein
MKKIRIIFDDVVNSAVNKRIPWRLVYNSARKIPLLVDRIRYIERITGLPYPPVKVSSTVNILVHEMDVGGIVHGNIDFIMGANRIVPIIDITLPFLLYGEKKVLTGVLAHEYLHYIFLAKKFIDSDFFSLAQFFSGTVVGRMIFDEVYQISPEYVFGKSQLSRLLERELDKMLRRKTLINKIVKGWIDKGYPAKKMLSQEFYIKLSPSEFKLLYFPSSVLEVAKRLDGNR